MTSAVFIPEVPAWISTPIVAGLAAYFGTYLGKRAERHAIRETMNEIERRAADISEAAKLRWTKRSEVCASLYGRLIMAGREFRDYLSPNTPSTDEAVERLRTRCKALDDDFSQNALFLPLEIKEQVEWLVHELGVIFMQTTVIRPAKPLIEGAEHESAQQMHIRDQHYRFKSKEMERFKNDGDIAVSIREIEKKLRSSLEVE